METRPNAGGASRPIRVMIVDDSAVIRTVIERILKSDNHIEVCGYAFTGEHAVNTVSVCNPDIILLDIEMPVMDGLTAIPLLLAKKADVKILMCSTLSERGAEISMKALSLGAADCILKPSGVASIQQNGDFHTELLRMVRSLGRLSVSPEKQIQKSCTLLRGRPELPPKIVAIGSSTGGPNALSLVMSSLRNLPVPLVITQHMPATFTRILADHLFQVSGVSCCEGQDGMLLQPGHAYIAPGGLHMTFRKTAEGIMIALDNGPKENFCKPAVDPMLRSLSGIYGAHILAVILTGMGEDGLAGARQVVEGGGQVIAQDQASSVVWGMPGAVAQAGLCRGIMPLTEIPGFILRACGRKPELAMTGERV